MDEQEDWFDKITAEEEDAATDTAEYKISTYGADLTLELLSKKYDEGEIKIPPFQRDYVWDIKKASKLIESFLLQLPVPQIFLFRDIGSQDLLVIDGQQRLKSINLFLKGVWTDESPFRLKSVKKEWEGKTFTELEPNDQRKFRNSVLRTSIFEQNAPEDGKSSMFQIFERLNSGGIILSQQEVRNCLFYGRIVPFLKELNTCSSWRRLLNKPTNDRRLKDIELILRIVALIDDWNNYDKPMKEFLNKWMEKNRNISPEKKDKISKNFIQTADFIENELKEKAFRLKRYINVPAVDSIFTAVAITGIREGFVTKYNQLIKDDAFLTLTSGGTTDPDSVKGRIKIALRYFK